MSRRLIEKNREQLSRETGTIYKSQAGNLRFALAFPNTYYVGMSSLGFQIVYRLLNDIDGSMCERVFLPDPPELAEIRRTNTSLLSMESQTPVRDFDVVAFSVSFEPDCVNLLRMLSLSRIDEITEERGPDQPLVIAGGPAVTFNPEPLAPFVDVFIIGEAEEVLPELVRALRENASSSRPDLLRALSHVAGVYVPSLYRPVYAACHPLPLPPPSRGGGMRRTPSPGGRGQGEGDLGCGTIERIEALDRAPERIGRRWVRHLEEFDATTAVLTPDTEFSNMVLAEVARGCGRQCRFCVAGYAFLPPRARSAESVLAGIHRAEGQVLEQPRIGLVSASVFDHPSSLLVCESLVERERMFSISSMRADTLNKDVAETLHQGGHETLTIAPEAGTERLRLVINKVMPDEEVLRAASTAWDGGFRRLKLYYMVGLPTETPEDVAGIADLTIRVAEMYPWERVTASVSCFVPKPWTPFQWAPMDEEKSLSDKLASVKRALGPVKSVEMVSESARESVVQGVLARGDRRLRDVLLAVAREHANWRAAFRDCGVDPRFYAQRPRHQDEVFPWDHLDLGVRKDYLWMEYERAMKTVPTTMCRVGVCRRCGVCHD